jgi:amino acid adenylation domain-containing protein
VIYTSGSTGRPKGVEIEHRSLVNFLCSMRDEIGVAAGDTLLAVTTLSFDIAGLELWLPLIAGATVVIASRTEAADAVALMARLRQSRPTLMQGTPATWQMLFDAGWDGDRRLTALCGGEGLPYALGRRLAEGTKQAWNLYGPTETTVWSSVCDVTRFFARRQSTASFESDAVVPIGYPIANTTLHILDGAHQVVPSGVPGELYIGGTGVARGYHGRPDATAERFLPDPFDTRESARLYRTGDRASRRDDGAIEHLGRLDDQVKLRGFRIETAEIEAALLRHPAVAQAAVVLQPPPFGPRLLAAVVPRIHGEGADADAQLVADLRAALRTALPEYMVPAAFAVLPELPRTPNGKTDRRALRDAGAIGARERTGRSPSTPTERLLCEVWAELLRVDAVTVDSNFFDLGGHSLRAARLSFRLAQERGVRLTLADIFQHPTVEALARLVDERGAAEPEAGVAAPAIPTAPMTAEELEMLNE